MEFCQEQKETHVSKTKKDSFDSNLLQKKKVRNNSLVGRQMYQKQLLTTFVVQYSSIQTKLVPMEVGVVFSFLCFVCYCFFLLLLIFNQDPGSITSE